jgi:hypothetical protein
MNLNYIIILVFNFALIYAVENPSHISNYSECINGALADNETQCNVLSVIDKYCCYLSTIDKSAKSLCLSLNTKDFHARHSINYNQITYNIYCGYGSTNAEFNSPEESNRLCFKNNPLNYQECYKNSTETNSCCYYRYKGMSGCYWLGISYGGSTINDEIALICSNSYLKLSHFLLILIYFVFYSYFP